MKYAVIALQGKQYKVSVGDKLTVDLLDQEADKTFVVSDVLLINDEGKVQVGTPLVEKAKVTLKVLENGKDAKLVVGKYKSKSKYRKVIGHRQRITNLEVMEIS